MPCGVTRFFMAFQKHNFLASFGIINFIDSKLIDLIA